MGSPTRLTSDPQPTWAVSIPDCCAEMQTRGRQGVAPHKHTATTQIYGRSMANAAGTTHESASHKGPVLSQAVTGWGFRLFGPVLVWAQINAPGFFPHGW
jgi:hypothetical protein